MSDPQGKINEVADSARNQRSQLIARINAPASLIALARVHPEISMLPEHKRRDAASRLLNIAYTSATKNSELLKCTPDSIIAGVVEAAQLGLSVDGVLGHAYLVPYRSRDRTLAQMQIGYRGYVALAYRSDRVDAISAEVICENDYFEYQEGSEAKLVHRKPLGFELDEDGKIKLYPNGDPVPRERGMVVGAYALASLRGATRPIMRVLNIAEILQHRNSSKAWQAFDKGLIKSTPWVEHFEAMARKTAIRAASSALPSEWSQRAEALESQRDAGVSEPPTAVTDITGAIDEAGDVQP